jgi:uncharacterized protein (DUF3820 family)
MPFDEYAIDLVLDEKNFYKTLLTKYMQNIADNEGILWFNDNDFSEKELKTLEEIALNID